MKYIKFFESWNKKEIERPATLKKNTYMFKDMYIDDKGDIKGICKFCEKATGKAKEVDVAEHTNKCPNIKTK